MQRQDENLRLKIVKPAETSGQMNPDKWTIASALMNGTPLKFRCVRDTKGDVRLAQKVGIPEGQLDLELFLGEVGREDGSGQSWNIIGRVTLPNKKTYLQVSIYYHSINQIGSVAIPIGD